VVLSSGNRLPANRKRTYVVKVEPLLASVLSSHRMSSHDFDFFFATGSGAASGGRGFSQFNALPDAAATFLAACRRRQKPALLLQLSRLKPADLPLVEPPEVVIVHQDLSFPAFAEQVEGVVERLIYPLWHGRHTLCFFSGLDEAAYRQKNVTPVCIHNDYTAVLRFLLCEQMLNLLASPPLALSSPPPLDLPIDTELDFEQDRARQHLAGPIRVLAPAGSGKTKTLTNRIVHLLNSGVPAPRILALAFNKKAAGEMNDRLRQKGVTGVEVRTFHALGYQIVRQKLGWRFDTKQAGRQTRRLLHHAVNGHVQLPARRGVDPLDNFLLVLRQAKTELPPLEEMAVTVEEQTIAFGPIFNQFLQLQYRHQLLAFDDMIYLAARLLLKDDDLRRQYQERFSYVLVDEFQDLNKAQLLLLQILALPENNLFVVGDDDQMIYGWRGAEIRHIMDFTCRFPMAVDVTLRTNYRCSRKVVGHSRRLIDHNQERVYKEIQPRPGAQPGHFAVELCRNLWDQATLVAEWLCRFRQRHNQAWRDFAVLYRYRAYQYPLALALDRLDVPHSTVNVQQLFTTPVGLDLVAYCTAVLQPDSLTAEEMRRLLKRPNKSLTNQLIDSLPDWRSLLNATQAGHLRPWEREKLLDFTGELHHLRRLAGTPALSPTSLLHHLETAFGFSAFYGGQRRASAELDEANDLILFETLFAVAGNFREVAAFVTYMRQAVAAEAEIPAEDDGEAVVLSTIHQAKGKEWPNVVYFNLSRGSHSTHPDEIEEERRVAYVAVTRARDNVLITAVDGKPSPFLFELTADPELAPLNLRQLRRKVAQQQRQLSNLERQIEKRQQDDPRPQEITRLEGQKRDLVTAISRLEEEINSRLRFGAIF
jgi:DNA helicase II / ATP-dependent DNA helicase PcrA